MKHVCGFFDISSSDLIRLELQLEIFIDDMRKDVRFKCVNHLGDLSILLVETKSMLFMIWFTCFSN
jgi:hypothetical protein